MSRKGDKGFGPRAAAAGRAPGARTRPPLILPPLPRRVFDVGYGRPAQSRRLAKEYIHIGVFQGTNFQTFKFHISYS